MIITYLNDAWNAQPSGTLFNRSVVAAYSHVADMLRTLASCIWPHMYILSVYIHTYRRCICVCYTCTHIYIYIYKYMKSNHIYRSTSYTSLYIYIQTCIPMDPIMISQETPQVGILFGHFATTGDGLHVRHLSASFPRGNDGNAMEKRPIYLGQL